MLPTWYAKPRHYGKSKITSQNLDCLLFLSATKAESGRREESNGRLHPSIHNQELREAPKYYGQATPKIEESQPRPARCKQQSSQGEAT